MTKKSQKKKTKKVEKQPQDKSKTIKKIISTKKNIKIKKKKTPKIIKSAEKKIEKEQDKKEIKKEEKKEELKNVNKTVVNNEGGVELDQAVEDKDRYVIVEAKPLEYEDKYYSITFNYTNVKKNNNKFYIIQLLQDIYTNKYGVLFRWGRVGKFGQVNFITYNSFEEARLAFMEKL